MAVISFKTEGRVYHYPPTKGQPKNQVTLCGKKAVKGEMQVVDGSAITPAWQPCDQCSEADDFNQRFVGTF